MSLVTTLKDALTASLLKAVLPESLLAEMMPNALIWRGNVSNLDEPLEPGIYQVSGSTQGRPTAMYQAGILIVAGTKDYCQHLYLPVLDPTDAGGNRHFLIRSVWMGKARNWRSLLNQFSE